MSLQRTHLGLSDLIHQVVKDLLTEHTSDDPHLFSIDEIELEINFVVSGDIKGGFNLGVVTAGSQVNEERTQKITLKLTPLIPRDQLIARINETPSLAAQVVEDSASALIKGTTVLTNDK